MAIEATVSETQIDVSVSGGVGPTGSQGSSGVVTVSAPITNSGTTGAAQLALSVGSGLEVSGGSLVLGSHTHALSALTQSGATTNQVIAWNGTAWAPATLAAGSSAWNDITGKPSEFPPAFHLQSTDTITTVSGEYSLTNIDAFVDAVANDGYSAALANVLGGTLVGHTHLAADMTFAASDRLLGRSTGGGGAGQEITCTATGRGIISLNLGTAGQVLKVNSGATGVEWGQADVDVLHDTVSSTAYTGRAAPGSATSASVWKIRKTVYSSAGAVSSTATATNVKWDDRLTASYS